MDRKHLVLMAAVILFAALLWWLSDLIHLPPPVETGKQADAPDYIMENFHATQTNQTGKVLYRLAASKLTHYPMRHESLLDQPVLIQYQRNATIITTRAERAQLPDDGRKIHMESKVRISEHRGGRLLSEVTANRTDVLLQQPATSAPGTR